MSASPTYEVLVDLGPVGTRALVSGPEDGPVVCALHSAALDAHEFDGLREALPEAIRFISFDQRGHGQAVSAPADSVTLAHMAVDVSTVLDTLDVRRPVRLVGHSAGGLIAALAAEEDPRRYPSLHVAASPAAGVPAFAERARAARQDGMAAMVEPTLRRWFGEQTLCEGGSLIDYARACINAMTVDAWAALWESMARFPGFAGLRLPRTYCVSGEEDASTPPEVLDAIAESVTAAGHTVLSGVGHMFPMEAPMRFAAVLTEDWSM